MTMFDSLSLHTIDDENGVNLIQGQAIIRATGQRRAASREDVELVLMALAGREPQKKCNGPCRKEKGIGEFASNVNRRDGRNDACRICERKRVKLSTQRRKNLRLAKATR